ncbi:hypothetical protein [Vulcanisaeta souniana]|uniref:hypothetical protein n=1 Tax=Vulcanisaeta souniana TaxID=164452 RepID=UPI0006D1213D|nr:hypothetical protein [Vulcanisaeta souniana]
MQINKPFIPVLTALLLIIALFTPLYAIGGTYVGFYNIINWPVISVVLYNGTSTGNGVVIVITPENPLNQQYEAFSGIGLISDHYFLINGVIYANGTINIASLTPVNASMSSGGVSNAISGTGNNSAYGGFEHVVIGGRTYGVGQIRIRQLPSGLKALALPITALTRRLMPHPRPRDSPQVGGNPLGLHH